MSNNSEENQSSTSMAEETLQMNATETPDPPSVPHVSTDSNDKAVFAKPCLPNKASDTQSIDSFDSTSGQDTQSVGHVENQSSASNTLSSTVSVFVRISSRPKSPKKLIPSSPDSHSSIESFDSVPIGDSQYIGCEETQSSSVTFSSTANVMVHFDSREDGAELRQSHYTTPTRKSVNVEDQKRTKFLFERKSVSSDNGTKVYGQELGEEIVHGTPTSKHLSSTEIKMQLNKLAVGESLMNPKEKTTDTRKKSVMEQVTPENQMQLKDQLEVDKSKVNLSEKHYDESELQLRGQISTEKEMLLRKQEASGSKLQPDPASAATNKQAATKTESNLQLSLAPSAASDPTSQLPVASSSTQKAPSRFPPRKVKLTADSLPSWKNMTMAQARCGRGMYGGRFRQYGEDSPPNEKRTSAFARDLPEISVQNIIRGIHGRRFQKMCPSETGLPPYSSLSQRLFLDTMAEVVDLTKKKKKKKKKARKRRSGYACAEEIGEDSWASGSSDEEPKSPKKSLPPSPELQFHLEL